MKQSLVFHIQTLHYNTLFNTSREFLQVVAIDHSGRLLDAALKLQQGKSLEIKCAQDLPFISIPLDEIEANVDQVQFQQVSVSYCPDVTSVQRGLKTIVTLTLQHNKQYHMKVLVDSFHLNGHTLRFYPQT